MYTIGESVTVAVPATSGNLGCGFDTFGLALDLWLTLRVVVCDEFSLEFQGDYEHNKRIPKNRNNVIVQAFFLALKRLNVPWEQKDWDFAFSCENRIPLAKGLGSSAAAIVAGLGAAFALMKRDIRHPDVLMEIARLACELEGHPDNVIAAVYGGMQIAVLEKERLLVTRVPFPRDEVKLLVHVPNVTLSTYHSRGVLPKTASLPDAAQNIGRGAMLVASLMLRDFGSLRHTMDDRLHQPFREEMCRHFRSIRRNLEGSGAYAAHLSGAGPSTVIWCAPEEVNKTKSYLMEICPSMMNEDEGVFLPMSIASSGLTALEDEEEETQTKAETDAFYFFCRSSGSSKSAAGDGRLSAAAAE